MNEQNKNEKNIIIKEISLFLYNFYTSCLYKNYIRFNNNNVKELFYSCGHSSRMRSFQMIFNKNLEVRICSNDYFFNFYFFSKESKDKSRRISINLTAITEELNRIVDNDKNNL